MKTLLLTILALCSTAAAGSQETIIEKDLRQLMQLFEGEFNNYNQVNFQNNDFLEQKPSSDYSRLHQQREVVKSNSLTGHWLYSQINRTDRDGKVYRQIFQHFYIQDNTIRSRVYKLADPTLIAQTYPNKDFLKTLSEDQLQSNLPAGCETTWRRQLKQFVGVTDFNTCVIQSKYKDEKRRIFSQEIIGERGFWGREGGYTLDGKLAFGLEAPNYYRYQRARPMTCWASVHLGNDEWEFYKALQTHDEGGSIQFGKSKQYRLQLKQTEFPASDWSDVFELFIYRGDEEKAFAYTWTQPNAEHIAVNLREVQASCKLASEN